MVDYIKRDSVIELSREYYSQGLKEEAVPVKAIRNIPSVDVAEVVRCKDCIHRPIMEFDDVMPPLIDEEDYYRDYQCPYVGGDDYYNVMPDDNWFCNHGERMDGET